MGVATLITSGKGGVGKSTISASLGVALAFRGRRVLMVDCDAGLRALDLMTGLNSNIVFDIADVVRGNCEPIKAIYPVGESLGLRSLYMLPSAMHEDDIIHPDVMKRLIGILSPYYDHILLDCPAGVGRGFISAAAAAQRALIVATCSPVSVRAACKVREKLDKMEMETIRLVINRFEKKSFIRYSQYEDLDGIIDTVGMQLIAVIPEDPSVLNDIINPMQSLREAPVNRLFKSNKSKAAMAIHRLAARMEGENIPLPEVF